MSPRTPSDQPMDALGAPWQRLLALSGVAFAVLLVAGWFLSGGNTPDYAAPDQDWTNWADDNRWRSRVGGFLILLAGVAFLHFAGTIRSVLESAEATVRGPVQLLGSRSRVPSPASRASPSRSSRSRLLLPRVPTQIR